MMIKADQEADFSFFYIYILILVWVRLEHKWERRGRILVTWKGHRLLRELEVPESENMSDC